jgi:GrpB-like predicted nucleotidyltransferase (UPF0157 family)
MNDAIKLEAHNPQWAKDFELERGRILAVLGHVTQAGILEQVHHVGSTSVPGLKAKPVIDMLLEVYPLPKPEVGLPALERLGYEYRGEAGIAGRLFFRNNPRTQHLHVVEAGTNEFTRDHLLFRDYLRANAVARQRYENLKLDLAQKHQFDREAYTRGKTDLIHELLEEATVWHLEVTGFQPVLELKALMQGFQAEWCVPSGWALDAFMGSPSRYHFDLDLLIWREDQFLLRQHLLEAGWELHVPVNGVYHPWAAGEFLELPLHQVHARKVGRFLDILFAERDGALWRFRRNPKISHDISSLMLPSSLGVKILAPEIVLLFKSRSSGGDARGKDNQDFARVLPHLAPKARAWLKLAVQETNPEHAWLEQF